MTALATLSIFIATIAVVSLGAYQAGEMASDTRHERIRMKRRWKFDDLSSDVLRNPFDGLYDLTTTLRAYESFGVASVIDRLMAALHTERTSATALHRRAQKAEGLLARREAKLEMERDRARKLHRRAQKAEGALRRIKWKVLKNGPAGILSAEDHAAFAADVEAFLEKDKGYPYQRATLRDSLKTRTQVNVTESGDLVSIGVHFDPTVVRDSIPKAPMPPIPVNGYWTGTAADLLPAAKPLSDISVKGPVTALPGLDLSGLTGPGQDGPAKEGA